MPRIPRVDVGNEIYHVINRANARMPIFFKEEDYVLFEDIFLKAKEKYDMQIFAYECMPNHFHMVVSPRKDGDLQKFMQWLTLTHTQKWHAKNKTAGTGHLYQGRYKSFLIQNSKHLLTVIRYVERNSVRVGLVKKAEDWKFSSLYRRLHGDKGNLLSDWPIPEPKDYLSFVNLPINEKEEEAIRYCVNRGKPFGNDEWSDRMIKRYQLESTLRKRGRQIKGT